MCSQEKKLYNYLLISDQIDNKIPLQENEIQICIAEIQKFLIDLKTDNIEALYRRGNKVTPEETFDFFRSQNRINNRKLIIQYLISFLEKIPLDEDIKKEEINPFKQFKLFSIRAMKLLREKDVRNSILKELETSGIINDNNRWYYKGRIELSYKEAYKFIKTVKKPDYPDYRKLFLSIMSISKFWFSQRNENINRIRKSDIYSYKLAAILVDRLDSTTDIHTIN